jgi:hypothetical protein
MAHLDGHWQLFTPITTTDQTIRVLMEVIVLFYSSSTTLDPHRYQYQKLKEIVKKCSSAAAIPVQICQSLSIHKR